MVTKHPTIEAFTSWLREQYRADAAYEEIEEVSGAEAGGADVAVRLCVANRSFYEVRVSLEGGEVQAGFSTENRMVNESIEQTILDNGGDVSELLADELSDLGEQPIPMYHFWERPWFRFTVKLPVRADDLESAELRQRVLRVLTASRILFQDCVDET